MDRLLRAEDVAARLAISRGGAYRLIQEGVIPSVRFCKSVRVRESSLQEWIAAHERTTVGQEQPAGVA